MNFVEFLKQHKRFSLATALKNGFNRAIVGYYLKRGDIVRLARGVYVDSKTSNDSEYVDFETLAECGYEFTVSLFSALKIHGFTTSNPVETWIAIPQNAKKPNKVDFPLRIVWLGDKSYNYGVQFIKSGEQNFKVYSPAKTVADLFKFRNKFGIDIAIEALKEGWKKHLFTADELYRAAQVCRVTRVIEPYTESVLS
jgi:predicted transcriptional regulator of viral defense system